MLLPFRRYRGLPPRSALTGELERLKGTWKSTKDRGLSIIAADPVSHRRPVVVIHPLPQRFQLIGDRPRPRRLYLEKQSIPACHRAPVPHHDVLTEKPPSRTSRAIYRRMRMRICTAFIHCC